MCCKRIPRRAFLGRAAGALAGAGAALGAPRAAATPRADDHDPWRRDGWTPERWDAGIGKRLRVQPILMYAVPERREAWSWKSWGGVQSEEAARAEAGRIAEELAAIPPVAGFPLEILPVAAARTAAEAGRAGQAERDVTVVFAATGSGGLLRACVPERGDSLLFVRHRSGPVYYWYEALSTRYLGTPRRPPPGDPPVLGALTVDDVVVDEPEDLLWRLRALRAARGVPGTRIVALGGVWGKYADEAPKVATETFGIDIVDVSYDDLAPRIAAALADERCRSAAETWTTAYLKVPGTALRTDREFVVNAFILFGLFKELLREHDAHAFTIKSCMGTILPMARTTACLTLSLLNDEGLIAFCESDFVVVPAGILLRYLAGTPVFLHNSTFPHRGVVTCAHCTGPRRMDGRRLEPAAVLTHYESEYGAAPKVEMPIGQDLTFVDPEYATGRWVGFRGRVRGNPSYEICRSQQDVEVLGDWRRLLDEVRDSHWLMVYGNRLEETRYAARKLGVRWEDLGED